MSPVPLFRWTSIAAPITSLLRRSAFLYNGCISERVFTEDSEGNKGWNWVCNLLRYLCFLLLDLLSSPDYRTFTEDSAGNEGWSWVLQPLRYLRFLLWIF